MGLGIINELQQLPKYYWSSDEGWQYCLYMAVAFPKWANHWNNMSKCKQENTDKKE